ncbi:MAG: DUF4845 domain-containing protein [Acidiferrobacterales bacterium]|nr:DUF4845 domain-containing protein [Acidiferrobacterales bacterium]
MKNVRGLKNKATTSAPVRYTKQGGWTMWSMMFVLGVLFVVAYLGMQLVPIFSANESVKNAMRISLNDKDLRKITRRDVIAEMQNQLYLDGNDKLIDYKNELKVARTRNQFIVEASYEREVPLVANLFLIARFNPKIECELSGQCDR